MVKLVEGQSRVSTNKMMSLKDGRKSLAFTKGGKNLGLVVVVVTGVSESVDKIKTARQAEFKHREN